ncbi:MULTISPECIES: hypothetical protein [Salmonella]|uniref:hypothetical protein n=1 Tax=Salmonella TaxID=590 RepID=UPI001D0D1F9E|nr:hypothetical protein [Salmonella enterica]MCW6683639.1 hypothetical protein [Salmonella enterica subsp. enterica serovar Potsdam]MCW6689697.1 hypothetical protein [Salmonella enterica subsp. enterica serovar Potsdam]MCW6692804.1 hypothetical protein [Salmonella enterica subsp. enterica serovar Potsdam]MCW6703492.1 hypothetical protein [Salmonella enterica subsp. enterica serovar Potsdam]MCW6708388.1 hypothetical protein [Salmonella enterica subsp. enterica serovar Potsdam]
MKRFMGTPGPWEWWTSNSFLRLSSKTTGRDGDVIDSFGMSDGATSLSVKADDMNLIAAAPDLLEALQLSLNAMNEMGDILNFHDLAEQSKVDELTPAFDKARAAISKALGDD